MSTDTTSTPPADAPDETAALTAGVPERLADVRRLITLLSERLPDSALVELRTVLDRSAARASLSGEHTVVALVGSTGGGKSSLFNALAELELSGAGVRRPTTSEPHACVWGSAGAGPLLDHLDVPQRTRHDRETALDGDDLSHLRGLVLLDLPDHDSTAIAHRRTVERMVELVDVIVWVFDPQKYADASIHEDFLQRFAGHHAVTVVVLNAIDTVREDDRTAVLDDLRRLLTEDGVGEVPIVATSTRTGEGVAELRTLLGTAVARRTAFLARTQADLDRALAPLSEALGERGAETLGRRERASLRHALEQAAGVPALVDVAGAAYVREGTRRSVWPLGPVLAPRLAGEGREAAVGAARPAVAAATRAAVDHVADQLPVPWASGVRERGMGHVAAVTAAVAAGVAELDREPPRPSWWRAVTLIQVAAAVVLLVGVVGIVAGFVPGLTVPGPRFLPVLLAVAGLALWLLVAAASTIVVRRSAHDFTDDLQRRLGEAVGAIAERELVAPLQAEAVRHRDAAQLLAALRS